MAQANETSDAPALAAVLVGGGGLALGAFVIVWQFYVWLKTGHWPPLTMATVAVPLVSGSDFSAWLATPQSWYGLHAVVRSLFFDLPLWTWIVFFASGAIFVLQKD